MQQGECEIIITILVLFLDTTIGRLLSLVTLSIAGEPLLLDWLAG